MGNARLFTFSPNSHAISNARFGPEQISVLVTLCVLLSLIASCSTNEPAPEPPVEVTDRPKTKELLETKKMSESGTPTNPKSGNHDVLPVPKAIMEKLVTAVAAEAGVSTEDVVLDRAERSTFSDSSLDCPQPNMAYSQVIVEGYWVVFHVGREEYDMRVTNRGNFTRCTGSTKRAPIRYDDT